MFYVPHACLSFDDGFLVPWKHAVEHQKELKLLFNRKISERTKDCLLVSTVLTLTSETLFSVLGKNPPGCDIHHSAPCFHSLPNTLQYTSCVVKDEGSTAILRNTQTNQTAQHSTHSVWWWFVEKHKQLNTTESTSSIALNKMSSESKNDIRLVIRNVKKSAGEFNSNLSNVVCWSDDL